MNRLNVELARALTRPDVLERMPRSAPSRSVDRRSASPITAV
ncbi:MAG: hypothetical protein ACXWCX_19125 [Burkholderiales bacterium]